MTVRSMTMGLRSRIVAACLRSMAACSGLVVDGGMVRVGDEAVALSKAGVEATVCSEAGDEAEVCSMAKIEDNSGVLVSRATEG
jgi:phosphate uptake regulator